MQNSWGLVGLVAGSFVTALNLYTTWLCLRHYRYVSPRSKARLAETKWSPVSILKPLKGADDGLSDNLESFFRLDYPDYELIFSVAEPTDPAAEVVRSLIAQYAGAPRGPRAQLIVGHVDAGPNPKVNNLIRSYATARHDLVLISDSNVRVDADYLRRCVELMGPNVGIVTAAVAGQDAEGLGGRLEAMYLNTFYARWMVAAGSFGFPTVIGKSMLFRKSTTERFGGIQNLSRYLAEDYMAGQVMRHLGLEVKVMHDPVPQVLGRHTIREFWTRHIRWGRMRKNMQLFPWLLELFSGPIGSALWLAIGFQLTTGFIHWDWIALHVTIFFLCDFLLMVRLNSQISWMVPFLWLARELMGVPMWLHTLCGNSVLWRGSRLQLTAGGVLAEAGGQPTRTPA